MSIRTLRSIVASILLATAMVFMAAPEQATAQPQNLNCCTYTIDIAGIPAACFPITVVTDWCPTGSLTFTVPGNGIWVRPVAGACPPFAPYFLTVAIAPGGPAIGLGMSGTVVMGGCVLTYTATTNAGGCIVIRIR